MTTINPNIEESWKQVLSDEFEAQYFKDLTDFLREEKKNRGPFLLKHPPNPVLPERSATS